VEHPAENQTPSDMEVTMHDKILRQDIIDELDFDPAIDSAQVGVAVADGVVTLTGYVKSYAEKIAAERAVKRVKGVKAIAEEIEVRYIGMKQDADDQIAKRVLDIIAWDTVIPDGKVKVEVQKGWVTLTGTVDWQYQRSSAEAAVRRLSGVKGITNAIVVQPRVQPEDVKVRIEGALKRSAQIDANSIRVSAIGGKVTLEGRVKAWHERELAERTAWAAPGVTAVEDRIVVT
jgi:osmotically-inducible protein OsmY